MAITVIREGNRWVARFPWDVATKDVVKAAGFRFDGTTKTWWTDKPEVAAKLGGDTREAVSAINAAREASRRAQEASIAASRAAGSDFKVPLSAACRAAGIDFLPYQRAGVEFAMQRRDSLVADEMGLGKTIQVLGLVNCDPSIKNMLVICPASLKLNWQREAKRWLAREMPVEIVNGGAFPASGVAIINYEMVGKRRADIDRVQWDLLVADESHYLKNPKAQRTHNVLGKWDRDPSRRVEPIRARRRMFLTGTPVLNRPVELWPLLHNLDPQGMGRNWKAFVTRYCAGHQTQWGWDVTGASNLDELQGRLRASIMVRRLKSQVLTELPAKRRQIIALTPETAEAKAAVKAEAEFVRDTEARLAKLRAELEALSDDEASEAYQAAAYRLREAQAVAFTETSKVRHRVALAKLPQVIDHVRDCLDAVPKLVLWAHHHDVVDQLAEALGDYGVLRADGRDSVQARDAAVQKFQSDDAARVIVCGIGAMGVGHTMTAASHAIFAELDWVPGNLSQAEDRCHRIGQRDAVLVQHLVLDGSLDARMCQMIVDKMGVIEAAVDNGGTLPGVAKVAMPVEHAPETSGKVTERSFGDAAADLPVAQVRAIHEAVRLLAGMCDGAYTLDGAGFNKLDTGFGHDLANQAGLSQRQAQAARRMVLKYVRQIPAPLYAIVKGG